MYVRQPKQLSCSDDYGMSVERVSPYTTEFARHPAAICSDTWKARFCMFRFLLYTNVNSGVSAEV